MISIRPYKDEDFEKIKNIENESFKTPYGDDDLIYETKENPLNKFIVICVDDNVVGFLDYMITFNSSTINQIAISKDYRKQGLALSLLRYMEDSFPKSGDNAVEFITLEVRVSNLDAINLYEKFGFEKITIKKNYYLDGEDAIYMVKGLL